MVARCRYGAKSHARGVRVRARVLVVAVIERSAKWMVFWFGTVYPRRVNEVRVQWSISNQGGSAASVSSNYSSAMMP